MAKQSVSILVTNDDGIMAPGLAALSSALARLGTVYVVAPDRERSTVGHALTLHRPLRAEWLSDERVSVNGTPSDCVNLALLGLLPVKPKLVVAGINHGGNLGDDVTYSGTVAAAMEGTLLGVPSIAVSLVDQPAGPFVEAGRVARAIAELVLGEGLPHKTLLNVNVPPGVPRGIRFTRLGHRVYSEAVRKETDPRGKAHYWIGAGPPLWEREEETDMTAVHEGHVSVTPLHMDLTDQRMLRKMTGWREILEERAKPPRGSRRSSGPQGAGTP